MFVSFLSPQVAEVQRSPRPSKCGSIGSSVGSCPVSSARTATLMLDPTPKLCEWAFVAREKSWAQKIPGRA